MRLLVSPPLAAVLCAAVAAVALAQPAKPASSGGGGAGGGDIGRDRLLHQFDFEEADDQNFEEMPRHWYVIGRGDQSSDPNFARKPLHRAMLEREGFPKYAQVKFNLPQERQGDHNLHLSLNGGSAGAFLEVGALAAVPSSDYAVTARIRTAALRHARARLIAYFVDAEGKRIDASAAATELLNTNDQWQNVSVRLLGEHRKAAWIGMQVELLQVQHQSPLTGDASPTGTAGKHAVVYQDVKGDAWFDDIAIWQAPRVVVRTQSPVNLIVAPSKPLLTVEVRDLSGRPLHSTLAVYDHRGRRIAEVARTVGGGEASTWQWSPPLPAYGWYLVDMTVRDPAQPAASASAEHVARTLRAVLWLPPRPRIDPHDTRRFTLDMHDAPRDDARLLPQLTAATGLSSVLISAFDADVSIATLDARLAELDALMQQLARQEISVMMSLCPVPRELTDRLDLDPHGPVWLLSRPQKEWSPLVAPLMLRHGQNIRRWRLGDSLDNAPAGASLPAAVAAAVAAIKELAPEPRIVLPWPLHMPRRADFDALDVEYTLDASASIVPAHLAAYLSEWNRAPRKPVTLALHIPPATEMDHARRVDELALRVLHAWEAGIDGITLQRPWATAPDRLSALHPDPLLGAFAGIAHQLTGRRAIGRLTLGDHQHAIIFDGPRGPMLAAWLDGGSDDVQHADLYLGESPRAADLWGNPIELKQVAGKHRLPLASTPIFVEAVDAELALFRASFAVTPKLIESSQVAHEHALTLTNPWPHAMQGELTILEPGRDWQISPRRISVSIEPGATATYPIQLMFPAAEVAGAKSLVARFAFSAGGRKSVEMTAPMELGLPGIELDTGLALSRGDSGAMEATATAYVTNQSDKPRSLYVFAIAAGHARQERIITLKPGQSVIRRFRFPAVNAETLAAPVRIGLRDAAGPALMNHVLRFKD